MEYKNLEKIVDTSKYGTLDTYCDYKAISKVQRDNEVNRGDGLKSTKGFEDMGCYNVCKGYSPTCSAYNSNIELWDK